MKHLLEFDSLYLEFGLNRVLSDVYMQCETGSITGLLGRNGSGKSCLMRIVFGTLKPYQKSIRIDGENILEKNIGQGWINYLPQKGMVPANLTVKEVFRLYGLDWADFIRWFPGMDMLHHLPFKHFSGGEKRLIEVYLILKSPTLFSILDEPFSYLSPVHNEKLILLLKEASQQKGIIITDHLYKHILDLSDKLYLLDSGKTREIENREDLVRFGYINHL